MSTLLSTILCILVIGVIILYSIHYRRMDALTDTDYDFETAGVSSQPANAEIIQNNAELVGENALFANEEEYQETINVIGKDKFGSMVKRIDYLSDLHVLDKNMIFNIVSGPTTLEGTSRLHALLPGDNIAVTVKEMGAAPECELYSQGIRIGSLMFDEAARFIELQRSRHITGIYVSAQNAYGDSPELSLSIVAFYSTDTKSATKSVNHIIDGIIGPMLSKMDFKKSENIYFSPN